MSKIQSNIFDEKMREKKHKNVVIPVYENYLREKGEDSRKHRGYSHFHPSSFGDCLRKVAFQYYSETDDRFKIATPIDTKFVRICDAGHSYHHRMQKDFAQMGILKGYWKCKSCGIIKGKDSDKGIFLPDTCECLRNGDKRRGINLFEYEEILLKSDSKYNFIGNCDGIIVIDDEEYIIDFKTMNTNMFSFLSKPDPKYFTQVMIYMWLAKVKKSIIFYEDKNLQEIKELYVGYDEGLVEVIKNNSILLKDMLENKKIPKINKKYSKDKSPCKWCDYVGKCFK